MNQADTLSSFQRIFEFSPIALWEFDFTELYPFFDKLKQAKTKNLLLAYKDNPQLLLNCFKKIRVTKINQAALILFEAKNLNEITQNPAQYFSTETANNLINTLNNLFLGKQEDYLETSIATKTQTAKHIRIRLRVIRNEKDKSISGMASAEDITEFKEQEERFEAFLTLNPDSITISKISDSKFSFVNPTFKRLTGFSEAEILNYSAHELGIWVNKSDRDNYFKLLEEKGYINEMPTSFRMKNGQIIEALLSARKIQYKGETQYIASSKNISSLNAYTKALQKSEEQFRKAFMNIPDAVHINKVSDSTFVDFNDHFLKYSGYKREEIIGKTPNELNIWTDGHTTSRKFYWELKKRGYIDNMEISFRIKAEKTLHALVSATLVELNGEPHVITVTKDISELKQAQQNLVRSEEQFRTAFNTNPDPVHIIDVETDTFVDVNQSFLDISGYSKEEVLGKKPEELNFWPNIEEKFNIQKLVKKNKRIDNFRSDFRMKDGKILKGLLSTRIIMLYGKVHFLSVIKDITQIHEAQEALAQSEEKFQSIFNKSPDALAIMETERWTYEEVNNAFAEISGYSKQEIIGKSTFELNLWHSNADRDFFSQKLQHGKEIINHEGIFSLSNGQKLHTLVSAKLIEINNKKKYLIIAKNIEDFVRIKQDLYEKDNRYKTIVNNSHEGICLINDRFKIEYANNQLTQITGYKAIELVGLDFREILTKKSEQIVVSRYRARQEGGKVPAGYSFQIVRKDGEIRNLEMHSSVLKTNSGSIQTIAQVIDITEREKAAKKIEMEHLRALQYFEMAGMMMIVLDKRGNITAVNKKGSEILEDKEANILGENWFDAFIPQHLREHFRQDFNKSIQKERITNTYIESNILSRSGKEKRIAWRKSLLKDDVKSVTGMIISGEDITSKEEVSRILNLSGLVAVLWKNDEGWPIEFVSQNAISLFGYTPDDFYSGTVNYAKLIHPDDYDRLWEEVLYFQKLKRIKYNHSPYRIITKNKEVKWINDHTTVQYDSKGNITYYYGVLSDISEDISRTEQLRQSNEIIAQMNDAIIISNFDGDISSWSGGAERVFEHSAEQAINKNIQLILGKTYSSRELIKNILNDIDIYGYYQNEINGFTKSGNKIPVELTGRILYDSLNNPLSLILVIRDITNRKIAQRALEESEKRYRHIFESILDGVIIYNMQNEIVQVNAMATRMYGYSHTEFTQTLTSRYIHPVRNHSFEEVMAHLGNNYDKMFEGESVDITKNGKKFFVNVKGRLIDYNNKPHLLIIVRNITKIKQAEHDLRKAKEKAIESEKLKSAFLANMSHEIRTPMNSIIGFSDLIGDDSISKEEKDHFIRIIRQNGNQLMTIINDIIDISKIEAGHIQLNFEPINLTETFQDIYNMFEIQVKDKGLKLISKPDKSSESVDVISDEMRLKQILINLISNALKFTHSGSIEFGYTLFIEENSIHFYVKDTGIGIPKNKQEEIFHRFMQAEVQTPKLYGGTGLGLAISLGLVHTFQGHMWLDSEEGNGSTFNFSIPLIIKNN